MAVIFAPKTLNLEPDTEPLQEAQQAAADDRVKQSVFGLLKPEEIKERAWG